MALKTLSSSHKQTSDNILTHTWETLDTSHQPFNSLTHSNNCISYDIDFELTTSLILQTIIKRTSYKFKIFDKYDFTYLVVKARQCSTQC